MKHVVAVWLAVLNVRPCLLAAQQPDTVPDSGFLAEATTRWPEQRGAFGEWRPFESDHLHAKAPRCRNVASTLTRDSVGPVRPGMTLGELLRVCPRALRLWYHDVPHDRWYPVVAVPLGRAILTGYLEDTLSFSKIRSLSLSDRAIRTPRGLRVGSTYGQLKTTYGKGDLNGGAEECSTVEVTFPALPGEFFDLDYASQCEDPGEAAVTLEPNPSARRFHPRHQLANRYEYHGELFVVFPFERVELGVRGPCGSREAVAVSRTHA